MEAFVWNSRFETDLPKVDRQHQRLVKIVNQVGDQLLNGNMTEAALEAVFKELADYARYHFADEERLMDEFGLDPRGVAAHKRHHQDFIEQVVQMWNARRSMASPADALHGFLSAWLAFHILAEDQSMARQIHAVQAGIGATAAYEREVEVKDNNVDALLSALRKLYRALSVQAHDLADANRGLEERVNSRTRDLSDANARLAQEEARLRSLVHRLEEAQNQMLRSEKLAAVGQLAAGVAHEINTPIGYVKSNLGTLGRYVAQFLQIIDTLAKAAPAQAEALAVSVDLAYLRQDVKAVLAESDLGLERVRTIVQDLNEVAHGDPAEWLETDINASLEHALGAARSELGGRIEVIRQFGSLPLVKCSAGEMNQVFMTLLVNAAQAIGGRGTITVRTGCEKDGVWIEIADTGAGMSPEVQKRLFEPFFTTKPVGKGTGLGLSLAYGIVVKRHGGRLEVSSAPGEGSTFRIWLPVFGRQG
ncbi:MAG TPA: bacteriohemerythrin [Rhodocyclaceae bacterium]|nr:bacteriohemerythrin [Rhodocyclaceae bacterium]